MTAPRPGERLADLPVVVALVGAAGLALLSDGVPRAVEWVLGVPFLLVLPGYAVVSATLPGSADGAGNDPGWPVRLALSLALSVPIVGAVGVVLGVTWGLRLEPAVGAVGAVTVAGALVAHYRRRRLPPGGRAPTLAAGLGSVRRSVTVSPQSVALAVALCSLAGAVALVGAAPVDRQPYSEFAVLAENDDGEFVAADYPRTFVAGQGNELRVVVENHEHGQVDYEVVVLAGSDGSAPDGEVVDRFAVRLAHGERAVVERSVAPETAGEDTRLDFLLYEGGAPADPDRRSADVALRLWVDVVEGDGPTAGTGPADGRVPRTTADGPVRREPGGDRGPPGA